MNIRLLHTKDCHIWRRSQEVLEEALKESGLEPKFEVILVKTQQEADSYKFNGSPTIQINGQDIDPMAKNIKKYTLSSCRPYYWQKKFYEYPPKEMILETIKEKHLAR